MKISCSTFSPLGWCAYQPDRGLRLAAGTQDSEGKFRPLQLSMWRLCRNAGIFRQCNLGSFVPQNCTRLVRFLATVFPDTTALRGIVGRFEPILMLNGWHEAKRTNPQGLDEPAGDPAESYGVWRLFARFGWSGCSTCAVEYNTDIGRFFFTGPLKVASAFAGGLAQATSP
jgi:hypothetical protein